MIAINATVKGPKNWDPTVRPVSIFIFLGLKNKQVQIKFRAGFIANPVVPPKVMPITQTNIPTVASKIQDQSSQLHY